MQNVSQKYKQYISKRSVVSDWHGTITFEQGTSVSFNSQNIDQNKSKVTRQCVSGENLEIGNVFAAELRLALRDSSSWKISDKSYNFYDAQISLWFTIYYPDNTHEDVFCGTFTINEAERTYHTVTLTAYDAANKFVKKMEDTFTDNYTPYNALSAVCAICDVPFGMTQHQVQSFPNGTRDDLKMSIYKKGTSYKDVLGNICTILGCNALCDRYGRLMLIQYGTASVRAIGAGERYSSSYIDYQGYYTTIYAVNENGEIDEYADISPAVEGLRKLATNIGKNTLLNSYKKDADDDVRTPIVMGILDELMEVRYSPCNVTMPVDPALDVADMVSLIGGEITGAYTLTLDTTVVEGKTYYEKSGSTYTVVTPVSTDNPSEEEWYEAGTSMLCTKIEMPLYGQMKITSEAGSYELDVDYYATQREQDRQTAGQEEKEKWQKQEETNTEVGDDITNINNSITDINNSITNIDGEITSLATKMAINYIFPYFIYNGSIADGGEEYVLRFRFKCDREGDTVAFYSMVAFAVSTKETETAFNDCNLTVKYYLDDTLTVQCVHTYGDGNAILTLNGCMTDPGAGEHTFDVKFAVNGGGIA